MEGFAAHQWGPVVILGLVVSIVVHQLPINGKRNQPKVQNSEHGSIIDVEVSSTGQSSEVSWPPIEPSFASLTSAALAASTAAPTDSVAPAGPSAAPAASTAAPTDPSAAPANPSVAPAQSTGQSRQVSWPVIEPSFASLAATHKQNRDSSVISADTRLRDVGKEVGTEGDHILPWLDEEGHGKATAHKTKGEKMQDPASPSFIESITSRGVRNFTKASGRRMIPIVISICLGCFVIIMCVGFVLKRCANSATATETADSESIKANHARGLGVTRGLDSQNIRVKQVDEFGRQSTWDGCEKDQSMKRRAEAIAQRLLSSADLDSKSDDANGRTSTSGAALEPSRRDLSVDDFQKEFYVRAHMDNETKYLSLSWLTPAEAENHGLPHACMPMDFVGGYDQAELAEVAEFERITAPWTPQALRQLFAKYQVDTSSWKEEKVQALATELAAEKSFLMVTSMQHLHLVVDVLELLIVNPNTGEFLVAQTESEVIPEELIPCIRKNAGETIPEAAQRCLQERIGLPSPSIAFNWTVVKSTDAEETSDDFLGLTTIKRKRCVCGKLVGKLSSSDQKIQGWTWKGQECLTDGTKVWIKQLIEDEVCSEYPPQLNSGNIDGNSSSFSTRTTASTPCRSRTRGSLCLDQHDDLKPVGGSLCLDQHDDLKPVVPWTEQEVKTVLEKYSTDASAFGMSLQELSTAASFNSLYFCRRCSDDQLVCARDEVLLRLISPDCQMLLAQKSGHPANPKYQWLKSMKRLDESAWDAVRRLLRMQLSVLDDTVQLSLTPQEVRHHQEVGHEGGRVVHKIWIMSGHIPSYRKASCDHLFPSFEARFSPVQPRIGSQPSSGAPEARE